MSILSVCSNNLNCLSPAFIGVSHIHIHSSDKNALTIDEWSLTENLHIVLKLIKQDKKILRTYSTDEIFCFCFFESNL